MERLTQRDSKKYTTENTEAVINRLGRIEDILEQITSQQILFSEQLEALRNEGKKNSTKFRELMGKKLTNAMILTAFEDVD